MIQLREQALTWLRAELNVWQERLAKEPAKQGPRVQQLMWHLQQDPDFAGVRDPEALAELAEGERQAWQKLWEEVAELERRTTETM